MQQTYITLYGGDGSMVTENKWYMRFKPTNFSQVAALEEEDIELFDYPLHYEVVQEGVTPAT